MELSGLGIFGKLTTEVSFCNAQRPHSSFFLGLPYRILYMNPKKELLWGLWVTLYDRYAKCVKFARKATWDRRLHVILEPSPVERSTANNPNLQSILKTGAFIVSIGIWGI